MERLARQDATQKATTEQLAAITALLAPLAENPSAPTTATIRSQLFHTKAMAVHEQPAAAANTVTFGAHQTVGTPDEATLREIAELKLSLHDINSKIHHFTSSAPEIDHILATTLTTPFTQRISEVRLKSKDKFRLPSLTRDSDPQTT